MIKQFGDWLLESKQEESAKFIANMKAALKKKGISYQDESSNAQLNNGTLSIKVVDNAQILQDDLNERGIKPTDFENDTARVKYFGYKLHYTIYSRGAIRVFSASSDSLKFEPEDVSKAADWIENHYKNSALSSIANRLKPDNFVKPSKAKSFPKTEIAKVFTAEAMKDYEQIEKFASATPEIVFAIFLAKVFNTKVEIDPHVNRNLDYVYGSARLKVKTSDDEIYLTLHPRWKVGTKTPTVEVRLDVTWYSRNSERDHSPNLKAMATNGVIPERFLDIYAKIKKGDYDVDSFVEKAKYAVSGKKFGI